MVYMLLESIVTNRGRFITKRQAFQSVCIYSMYTLMPSRSIGISSSSCDSIFLLSTRICAHSRPSATATVPASVRFICFKISKIDVSLMSGSNGMIHSFQTVLLLVFVERVVGRPFRRSNSDRYISFGAVAYSSI